MSRGSRAGAAGSASARSGDVVKTPGDAEHRIEAWCGVCHRAGECARRGHGTLKAHRGRQVRAAGAEQDVGEAIRKAELAAQWSHRSIGKILPRACRDGDRPIRAHRYLTIEELAIDEAAVGAVESSESPAQGEAPRSARLSRGQAKRWCRRAAPGAERRPGGSFTSYERCNDERSQQFLSHLTTPPSLHSAEPMIEQAPQPLAWVRSQPCSNSIRLCPNSGGPTTSRSPAAPSQFLRAASRS